MDFGRYILGVLAAAVAFVPLALASRALRRRYLTQLAGAPAALAEIVIALSVLVCVSELLGSVGLFRLIPMVLVLSMGGVIVWRRTALTPPVPADPPPLRATNATRWEHVVAVAAVALLVADWTMRAADSFQRGMSATADTLWYHMPVAARFVETGWTPWLHFVDGGSLTVFYPANAEVFHAIGIMFLGSDVLSPLINYFWLGLALLAAWCIGRPFGVAPISMVAVLTLIATPELVLDDAGSAYNDIVGLALLLAAVALVLAADIRRDDEKFQRGTLAVAALAAGLALGTKYTMIPAVGGLTVAVVVLMPRRRRVRHSLLWIAMLVLTGGYWYVRNLFATGNPIPTLRLGIGPIHLPTVPVAGLQKLTSYIFDGYSWRKYLLPGLRDAFGAAWWLLLALSFAGLVFTAVTRSDIVLRAIAVVGVVSLIAYVTSPQILGFGAVLSQFETNVRYADPALVLGMALLPIVALRISPRASPVLLGLFGAILVVTQFDRSVWRNTPPRIASATQGSAPRVWAVIAGVAVVVVGVGLLVRRAPVLPRVALRAAAVVVLVPLVLGGYAFERSYLSSRYTDPTEMGALWNWAQHVHGKRIAIVNFSVQYPLYGKHLSNYVQYVAHRSSDGKTSVIGSCADWRQALVDGRYDYLVVSNPDYPFPSNLVPPQVGWTQSDPAARLLLHRTDPIGTRLWLFRIDGALDPRGCRSARTNANLGTAGTDQTRRVTAAPPATSQEH